MNQPLVSKKRTMSKKSSSPQRTWTWRSAWQMQRSKLKCFLQQTMRQTRMNDRSNMPNEMTQPKKKEHESRCSRGT